MSLIVFIVLYVMLKYLSMRKKYPSIVSVFYLVFKYSIMHDQVYMCMCMDMWHTQAHVTLNMNACVCMCIFM